MQDILGYLLQSLYLLVDLEFNLSRRNLELLSNPSLANVIKRI